MTLPPEKFRPAPKVESAVVRFRPLENTRIPDDQLREDFDRIVRAAFQARRKTLANGLAALGCDKKLVEETLEAMELNPKIRPQRLSFQHFAQLAEVLRAKQQL